MAHPPQGYFAPQGDPGAGGGRAGAHRAGGRVRQAALLRIQAQRAYSRSRKEGCSRCIDIARPRRSAPTATASASSRTCAWAAAPAPASPSGAMRYNYPDPPYEGERLRAALGAWQHTAGSSAPRCCSMAARRRRCSRRTPRPKSPAELLPIALHDAASVGPDLLLYALCAGAARVLVWQHEDAPPPIAPRPRAASLRPGGGRGLGLAAGARRFVAACGDAEGCLRGPRRHAARGCRAARASMRRTTSAAPRPVLPPPRGAGARGRGDRTDPAVPGGQRLRHREGGRRDAPCACPA